MGCEALLMRSAVLPCIYHPVWLFGKGIATAQCDRKPQAVANLCAARLLYSTCHSKPIPNADLSCARALRVQRCVFSALDVQRMQYVTVMCPHCLKRVLPAPSLAGGHGEPQGQDETGAVSGQQLHTVSVEVKGCAAQGYEGGFVRRSQSKGRYTQLPTAMQHDVTMPMPLC